MKRKIIITYSLYLFFYVLFSLAGLVVMGYIAFSYLFVNWHQDISFLECMLAIVKMAGVYFITSIITSICNIIFINSLKLSRREKIKFWKYVVGLENAPTISKEVRIR